jgi:hypothetical protein
MHFEEASAGFTKRLKQGLFLPHGLSRVSFIKRPKRQVQIFLAENKLSSHGNLAIQDVEYCL